MESLSIEQINNLQKDNTQLKRTLIEINKLLLKMKEIDEDEVTVCYYQDKECEKCSDEKCMAYWFAEIKNKVSEVLNEVEHN